MVSSADMERPIDGWHDGNSDRTEGVRLTDNDSEAASRELQAPPPLENMTGPSPASPCWITGQASPGRTDPATETSQAHLAFLARAGAILGDSLDHGQTLLNLLDLAVPALTDLCAVYHLDERHMLQPLAVRHADPAREQLLSQILPPSNPDLDPFLHVVTSGKPLHIPAVDAAFLASQASDPDHHRDLLAMKFGACLLLPLRARGRVIGLLALSMDLGGRTFDEATQSVAMAMADRAALAIDNARLFRDVQLANQRKTELLSLLGHELRNPLAAISNALEALDRFYPLEAAGMSHRNVIHRQVHHLAQLADDLLGQANLGATCDLTVTPAAAPPLPQGPPAPPQTESPIRILLCEDHVDAGATLVDILTLMGFHVHWVQDGAQGVAMAAAFEPHIALVDIGLPGMDGYHVARCLRERFADRIRLVALTGYGLPEDRAMAMSVGFDTHLTKPVDIDTLVALLQRPHPHASKG